MLQFYFLSIFLNFFGGIILSAAFLKKWFSPSGGLEGFFEERGNLKLIIGILSILVGILKFLSVVEGDVKVIGDLFPALSGLMIGLALLADYYRSRTDVQTETGFNTFLEKYQVIIGVIAMAVAVLHFFIPRVLFL